MRLVYTEKDVAMALQKSVEEFAVLRPKLEGLGFPKPIPGLEDRWSIMDVINWVNHEPNLPPARAHKPTPASGSKRSSS